MNETSYLMYLYQKQEKLKRDLERLLKRSNFSVKKVKKLELSLYRLNKEIYLHHCTQQQTKTPRY